MQSNDAELIKGYLAGAPSAVRQVDEWVGRAASPFRRRLSDDWEDLLQDVRLEITRLLGASKFRGESTLKTYLWRVTNNACVDRIRSLTKVQWDDLETVDQRGEPLHAIAAESATSRESRDLMLRVLARMSEDCTQLWKMLFQGLSYQEMSRHLGVSEGALRVRVLRCRRRAVEVRKDLSETK